MSLFVNNITTYIKNIKENTTADYINKCTEQFNGYKPISKI